MKLGVIGTGKMGTALVGGAIRSGAVAAADVTGVDPYESAREQFEKTTGAKTCGEISALGECEVILLCTRPRDIGAAMRQISEVMHGKPVLVLSIAAGVTIAALEEAAGEWIRIIRAMPNTPALVGQGAAAYCLGSGATKEDSEAAVLILGSVGLALEVPERLLDAVTGLSGSGPAYVYMVIEAMADGGVKMGLLRTDALRLAAQTVLGAASMVVESGEHPALLKDRVTSPGGTTITGVAELERQGLRNAMIEAVCAATRRSTELGS